MPKVSVTNLDGETHTFNAKVLELVCVSRGELAIWELWGDGTGSRGEGCCVPLENIGALTIDGFKIDVRIIEPSARDRGLKRKRRK